MSGFAVEFAGCVWTEAVSGKKKLRIQKYPRTKSLLRLISFHQLFPELKEKEKEACLIADISMNDTKSFDHFVMLALMLLM